MSPDTETLERPANRDAVLKAMYQEIHDKNLFPFWATGADVEHDEIKQLMGVRGAVPYLWSYKDTLESLLYRSAELVTMNDSERRSLILVNPGLAPPAVHTVFKVEIVSVSMSCVGFIVPILHERLAVCQTRPNLFACELHDELHD